MKKMLLMAGVILLGAVACKKDDDNGGSNPTTSNKAKMVALWNGESVTQKVIIPGQGTLVDTTFSVSGFTLDFMNDDKLVLSDGVDSDTLNWYFVNNTTIQIEGLFSDTLDTYQVLTLDNNNFDIKTSFQEELLPGVFGTIEGTLRMNK